MTDPTDAPDFRIEIGNGGTGGDGGNAVVTTQVDVTGGGGSSADEVTVVVTHTEVGTPGTNADGTSNIVILPDSPHEVDFGASPTDGVDVHGANISGVVDYWII